MKRLLALFLILVFADAVLAAAGPAELVAPGGGEMDLIQNVIRYFGTETQPAVVNWDDLSIEAKHLEYDRNQGIVTGKEMVKLTQQSPLRILECAQLTVELNRNFLTATGNVNLRYDQQTTCAANRLEWDRAGQIVRLAEKPEISYQEWRVSGEQMEAQLDRGIFSVFGRAQIIGNDTVAKAGRIVFERDAEKAVMRENPIVVRGTNELSATEIIYDFRTKKLSANGEVRTRIIKDKQ
jgi:lipopolysaccharide export system protein LptA